jgi:hypothetical protein
MNEILPKMNDPFSLPKAGKGYLLPALTTGGNDAIRRNMKEDAILFLVLAASALAGCVQVSAPDKPIVINLNIAIRQEVLYRLDQASKEVIEENSGIF